MWPRQPKEPKQTETTTGPAELTEKLIQSS